jgi:Acetyl-CoA hydrolase/transferase C-terminal domain
MPPERAELGPGQPPAFMRALGEREDWTDLRVYSALLAVGTELFSRPGVHYLSGFYGPIERALRDMGANVEFAPADFRRLGPLLERQSPRVMTLQSRIVPWFGPGAVITTPRHQVDVIVTEYGAAELEGLTVRERGEALAAIAHPQFRGELLAAAERASKGRSPVA